MAKQAKQSTPTFEETAAAVSKAVEITGAVGLAEAFRKAYLGVEFGGYSVGDLAAIARQETGSPCDRAKVQRYVASGEVCSVLGKAFDAEARQILSDVTAAGRTITRPLCVEHADNPDALRKAVSKAANAARKAEADRKRAKALAEAEAAKAEGKAEAEGAEAEGAEADSVAESLRKACADVERRAKGAAKTLKAPTADDLAAVTRALHALDAAAKAMRTIAAKAVPMASVVAQAEAKAEAVAA